MKNYTRKALVVAALATGALMFSPAAAQAGGPPPGSGNDETNVSWDCSNDATQTLPHSGNGALLGLALPIQDVNILGLDNNSITCAGSPGSISGGF